MMPLCHATLSARCAAVYIIIADADAMMMLITPLLSYLRCHADAYFDDVDAIDDALCHSDTP